MATTGKTAAASVDVTGQSVAMPTMQIRLLVSTGVALLISTGSALLIKAGSGIGGKTAAITGVFSG